MHCVSTIKSIFNNCECDYHLLKGLKELKSFKTEDFYRMLQPAHCDCDMLKGLNSEDDAPMLHTFDCTLLTVDYLSKHA